MRQALATLDELVDRLERRVIALSLAVMSVTVFMDVLHRRLSDPQSKLGGWLLAALGGADDAAWAELVHGGIAPVLSWTITLLLLVFVTRSWPAVMARGRWVRWAVGVLLTGALYGVSELVVRAPSAWVYGVMTVCLGAAFAVHLAGWDDRVRRLKGAVGLALGLLAAGYGITRMPVGYSWAQNFSLFLLLWVGFLGASVATRHRRHIQVDAFRKYVPERVLPWYNAASLAVAGAFSAFLLVVAFLYTFGPEGNVHQLADIGRVPDWLVTASLPVAFAIMAVRFTAQVVQELDAGRTGAPSPMGRHDGGTH